MARNSSRLSHLSRDRNFLARAFFGIVVVCGVVGLGLSEMRSKLGHRDRVDILSHIPTPDRDALKAFLVEGKADPESYAAIIRNSGALRLMDPSDLHPAAREMGRAFDSLSSRAIASSAAAQSGHPILADYAAALFAEGEEARSGLEALEAAAAAAPPVRFACEGAADVLRRRDHSDEAEPLFRREVENHPETAFSRAKLVEILLAREDGAPALKRLLQDKATGRALDSHTRMQAALATGNLGELVLALHYNRYTEVTLSLLAVTLFAGLIWFIILTKLGGVKRLRESRLVFCALAVLLGVLSARATLIAVVLQEHFLGLKETGEFVNDLVFFISGVGLREEGLKLLFIVPLVPFVLRRRSEAEMLAVSACVGLGFAIEENVGYFLGGAGFIGRMITANFLHIALTGALGLALFRLCRWPRTRWGEFLATFIAAVVLHGLYDALIALKGLQHVNILGILLFVFIVYRFFQLAREVREPGFQVISPLGVFVIGCAFLTGAVWIYSAWIFPLREAIGAVGSDALGIATLGFLYINQFRDE